MARVQGFIQDVQSQISIMLQFADAWTALQQEQAAMITNGIVIQQTDLDAIFGANMVSVAQFTAAFSTQQSVVDFVHQPANAGKLYRLKR